MKTNPIVRPTAPEPSHRRPLRISFMGLFILGLYAFVGGAGYALWIPESELVPAPTTTVAADAPAPVADTPEADVAGPMASPDILAAAIPKPATPEPAPAPAKTTKVAPAKKPAVVSKRKEKSREDVAKKRSDEDDSDEKKRKRRPRRMTSCSSYS